LALKDVRELAQINEWEVEEIALSFLDWDVNEELVIEA